MSNSGRWRSIKSAAASPARLFTIAVAAIAGAKIAAGSLGVVVSAYTTTTVPLAIPPWVSLVQMAVFGFAATLLILGSDRTARPVDLGTAFLLVASSFALRPVLILAQAVPDVRLARLPLALAVDAYLPYFLWRFFRDFPRGVARYWARRIEQFAVAACWTAGTALFLINLLLAFDFASTSALRTFAAVVPTSAYWIVVYGLSLPVIPFALWKTQTAQLEERKRLILFLGSVFAAAVPVSLYICAFSLSPAFAAWAVTPGVRAVVMPVLQLLMLCVPIATAYAVLVDRVLDVRLLLRLALQHAVARGMVFALSAAPFAWAAWYLYTLRGEPLQGMFASARGLPLLAAALVGLTGVRLRRRAEAVLDRTFFREQYDAKQVLVDLVRHSRDAPGPRELAELLIHEIDRALHLESVVVLIADQERGELRAPSGPGRPISLSSDLCLMLASTTEPVPMNTTDSASFGELPDRDREWLADTGAHLLVPLVAGASSLVGLLLLGMKRSELPFSREDRQLLSLIAASAALTIESRSIHGPVRQQLTSTPFDSRWSDTRARECGVCRTLESTAATVCTHCTGALNDAVLPLVLSGKFRLERRIGQGGMGVVYRGIDLGLQRVVALKTLPRTSPEDSVLLRREARAMAAVVHPNLATIYGVETWKGTPVLVVEYLDGGTLADRLAGSALPQPDVVELALALTQAIDCLHGTGILHRDVKPSNIGYTAAGVPKLLDFGLARLVADSSRARPSAPTWADIARPDTSLPSTDGLVGTPLYMSPEALRCEPPDASFDLWSVAVVLFEALVGRHPFLRPSWPETLSAIMSAEPGASPHEGSTHSGNLTTFFRDAMHPDRRLRPATAAELHQRLMQCIGT